MYFLQIPTTASCLRSSIVYGGKRSKVDAGGSAADLVQATDNGGIPKGSRKSICSAPDSSDGEEKANIRTGRARFDEKLKGTGIINFIEQVMTVARRVVPCSTQFGTR